MRAARENDSSYTAALTTPLDHLAVTLVSPRNPLNIGAVARAMSNFGCFDLRVVAIHNPDFREAASAVGPAAKILAGARIYATLPEAIADAHLVVGTVGRVVGPSVGRTTRDSVPAAPSWIDQAGPRLRATLSRNRVVLLFGSEKFGLSKEALSYCHELVTIPTRDEHASMNLGQAAAICLYELARVAAAPAAPQPQDLPTAGELERLTNLLKDALIAAGQPGMDTAFRGRQLRTLVHRAAFPGQDLPVWIGFLRQILWKLRP
jgi:TrmH family RNA methyltransferase